MDWGNQRGPASSNYPYLAFTTEFRLNCISSFWNALPAENVHRTFPATSTMGHDPTTTEIAEERVLCAGTRARYAILGAVWTQIHGFESRSHYDSDLNFDHLTTSMSPNTQKSHSKPAQNPNESDYTEYLKRKSSRESSARYRLRHREALLDSERLRAARRRAELKTTKNDTKALDIARTKAREASARYRKRNREALALKQREHRKHQFIANHGYRKFLDRALRGGATPQELFGGARTQAGHR
ncbi:hypothetical protein K438DRAFT_1784409 [Mycena galopus ATCC 62051]|nr:hypothetical protein K438DRAFT_1784409 [Mycena galopus ATCC 62051]